MSRPRLLSHRDFADWCNGSTTGFEPVNAGSIPASATKIGKCRMQDVSYPLVFIAGVIAGVLLLDVIYFMTYIFV